MYNQPRVISDATRDAPPIMQRSRAKLWVRTGILAVFGTLFSLALYPALASGELRWSWAAAAFLLCLAIGFWMRGWVPMQIYPASRSITLSFDRIYFPTILLLVIAKAITGRIPGAAPWTDLLMCVILGLMIGRLSGICLRVHSLKLQYAFIPR